MIAAMLEEYPPWGRRFTLRTGKAPWFPLHYLDFAFQVKSTTGKTYAGGSLHNIKEPKRHHKWRGHTVEMGWFWSEKNQTRMRFRSRGEMLWYQVLENRPDIAHYIAEPCQISYSFEGRRRTYIPDLLVTPIAGPHLVVEIKPVAHADEPMNQAKFEAARAWCSTYGMIFQVWTTPPDGPN
jgi:hypothetical protein